MRLRFAAAGSSPSEKRKYRYLVQDQLYSHTHRQTQTKRKFFYKPQPNKGMHPSNVVFQIVLFRILIQLKNLLNENKSCTLEYITVGIN